jgi:hypothetical protein
VGVTEERKETKFCEGGKRDGGHINTDRFRGLYQLLFISKRPLPAMRPANSGGEGEGLPCPVEVSVGGGRGVHKGGGGGGRGRGDKGLKAGTAAG